MPVSVKIAIALYAVGGGMMLLHLLLRRTRRHFIFIGLMIIVFGVMIQLPANLRVGAIMLQVVLIAMIIYEAILETKDRVRRLRQEHQEREEAFGEYLEALARKESQAISETTE